MKPRILLGLILSLIQFLSPVSAQSERRVELVVQTSHSGGVFAVSFSPDGQVLASAGDDNVILWEVKSGRLIRTFKGGAPVALGPDGRTLACVSDRKKIKLWDIISGKEIRTLDGHTSDIESLAFNYDGTILASGGSGKAINSEGAVPASVATDTTIKLWNLKSWELIHTLKGHISEINCLAFSPNGKVLASGSGGVIKDDSTGESSKAGSTFVDYDTTIKLWDVEKGVEKRTLLGHVRSLSSLRIKADGKTLVSASNDYVIKLWDIETGIEKRSISGPRPQAIAGVLSADGNVFASSTVEGEIEWVNVSTGEVIHRVKGPEGHIAFTSDNTGKVDKSAPSLIFALAFSADGKKLASGDVAASIVFWDVETGKSFLAAHKRVFAVTSARFSPDGMTLASVSRLSTVNLWNVGDVTEPKLLKTFEVPLGTFSVVFSPNGNIVASTDWFTANIILWDARSGARINTLRAHSKEILSFSFSVDGQKLVSESKDRIVEIWDVKSGKLLESMNVTESQTKEKLPKLFKGYSESKPIGVDASDKLIALATNTDGSFPNQVVLFDRKTEKELCTLISIDDDDWAIISPDGRFDTSEDLSDIDVLHWRIAEDPLVPFPLEVLMRGYYEPSLLKRVLRCNEASNCNREFKPLPSIADINRVQPKVNIKEVVLVSKNPDLVDVTVQVESVTEDVSISAMERTKKSVSSGVYDLRLFRNRQLVGVSTPKDKLAQFINDAPRLIVQTKASGRLVDTPEDRAWRETNDVKNLKDIRFDPEGRATFTFHNVRLPYNGKKQVEFSAYAFNADRVKSNTDRRTLELPSSVSSVQKKGRAYLLTIGVKDSDNPHYKSPYAANDARKMQEIVGSRLKAEVGKRYSEVIQIPLISDADADKDDAGKEIIKGVFSLLAGRRDEVPQRVLDRIEKISRIPPVEPDDTLIITFSGHGYEDQNGVFFMLPADMPKGIGPLTADASKGAISSDELSLWMSDITAKEMLMIIDSCYSAAAVQGNDFKPGPMGSRGLGQLAYDKGMRILAATQDVALELRNLHQGLLSYTLLAEGIEERKADTEAEFKQLTAAEWLGFAVKAVPQLYADILAGKEEVTIDGKTVISRQKGALESTDLQRPVLFDFHRQQTNETLFNLP